MKIKTKHTICAPCPGCDNDVYLDGMPELGWIVTCPECGDLLEVVNLIPLTLAWTADVNDERWIDNWD